VLRQKQGSDELMYCERVSTAEYEQQRHDVAHDALLHLLDDIVDNDVMSPSTKRRRLLQASVTFCLFRVKFKR